MFWGGRLWCLGAPSIPERRRAEGLGWAHGQERLELPSVRQNHWYLPVTDRDAVTVPVPTDELSALLAAYDTQLRGAAEMQGSMSWDRDGPLYRAQYERAGFVSYESLADVDDVDALIRRTVAYYQGLDHIEEFEWKTRGHDQPVDLDSRLRRAGFLSEEVETVMVGGAAKLAVDVQLPDGVVIRRVDHLPERPAGYPVSPGPSSPVCGVEPPILSGGAKRSIGR